MITPFVYFKHVLLYTRLKYVSSLWGETMAKFCERLKLLRNERGLKQREMAEQLGLAMSSYQCYEYASRYPEFNGLIAIADFFDVSLDYLVGRSDDRERR